MTNVASDVFQSVRQVKKKTSLKSPGDDCLITVLYTSHKLPQSQKKYSTDYYFCILICIWIKIHSSGENFGVFVKLIV